MKTNKITVETFPPVVSDFGICDVARVSMAKAADQYTTEQNAKLLRYLVKDKEKPHWSPFGHARICLKIKGGGLRFLLDCFGLLFMHGKLAGFSWAGTETTHCYLNGSLWAWYENWDYLPYSVQTCIKGYVYTSFPEVYKALFECLLPNDAHYGDDWVEVAGETEFDRVNYRSFRVTCPIFIARQLVKHQVHMCWNEESRRYIDEPPTFYDPAHFRSRPEGSIKQGSGGYLDEENNSNAMTILSMSNREARMAYEYLLSIDVAPEEARMVLPLNTQVQWIWTASVEAWKRVLKLRDDSHAQTQAQDFAKKLKRLLNET